MCLINFISNPNPTTMNVYESDFLRLDFFEEDKLIEVNWLPSSKNMLEENYKEEFTNFLNVVLELKPQKSLPNHQDMYFTIYPELQEWTNKVIFPPLIEVGLNKVAFVMNEEFIHHLSTEQTMEEEEGKKFNVKYFDNKEEAREWLVNS